MVNDQHDAPTALPPAKSLQYPSDKRLDVPQGRSGRGGEEKKSLTLPGIEAWSSSP
jgi:hypothetical protein